MKKVKKFWNTYKHGAWILAYMIFYLMGFMILENAGHRHFHVLHSVIDDLIPFCEYFIIPYYLWFPYMALTICWFVFRCRDKNEYYKVASVLSIGMTVFLVVSCVWPNMTDLRPESFARDNIFTQLVAWLYRTDTPTNVLPSIHVYNSMTMWYAIRGSRQLGRSRAVVWGSGILTALIVASTMFLKQHSVVDVSMGILMSFAVQAFCDRIFSSETAFRRVTG